MSEKKKQEKIWLWGLNRYDVIYLDMTDIISEGGCEVLLVGINYDKDAPAGKRKHQCVIEKKESFLK